MVSLGSHHSTYAGASPRNVHELGRECNTVIYEA